MGVSETQLDIIKKFVDNCTNSLCYLSIPSSLTGRMSQCLGKTFRILDLKSDFSPFKPFLSVLAEKQPSEELVKKYSYSIQTESLLTFLKNGYATERYDLPLSSEFGYETNRFIRTICDLLEKLNDQNYLVLNAQLMLSNSFQLLSELEKKSLKGKFVLCFNEDDSKEKNKSKDDFFAACEGKMNFLRIRDKLSDEATLAQTEQTFDTLAQKAFTDYNSLFRCLRNNRIFVSNEQLITVTEWAVKNLHTLSLTPKKQRDISLEIALAYYSCSQYDKAILYLNDVIESPNDDELTTCALFYLTSIFFYKKSGDFAKRYTTQLLEHFAQNADSPYYALYEMTYFLFSFRADLQSTVEKYHRVMTLLEDRGYVNNFISTGLSIPWSLIDDKSNREFIDSNIDKCYNLAKKIDNQHLVSKACHWKGIIHSHYGEGDEAMKWYYECNKIRTEIGEIGPLMNIRNGLSYESVQRAKYEDAYNLVNDVIKNLYNMNDYATVIDTLKNIGYALFYSRNFKRADAIFSRILHYLHIFDMEECATNSFLPSVNDMLIFKSIIQLNDNDYIHARINYNSIIQSAGSITSEDRPLLSLIKAALLLEDGKKKDAFTALDEGIAQLNEIQSDQSHKICFVCCEFGVILETAGLEKESERYFKKARSIAIQKHFDHYTHGRELLNAKSYMEKQNQFAPLNIDLLFLDEKADKEVLLTQLHKRIHDYQFLNKIKATNGKEPNLRQYIENASAAIFEYTMCDAISICEYKNNTYETLHSVSRNESRDMTSDQWWELFEANSNQSFSQLVYDRKSGVLFGNISQFDYRFGIAIIPNPANPLTNDDINTLNIAISNIQAQIIIFKQNENLMFLSSTDQLSLLNNRHALQQYISMESDKIRRYRKRKSANIQIALAFLDLDNFKFYNDTFGHSAGDLLITSFSNLLKKTCRQIDFISRFGGDEFVIVMVDTSVEEALRVNQRLKENLEKEQYFIPALEKFMGDMPLDIPENRHLGFSMGICTNFDDEDYDDLNKVLIKADQALYYSKEHCKGEPSVWSEVRNLISQ